MSIADPFHTVPQHSANGQSVSPKIAGATAEDRRLALSRERTENWKRWGPYLSERQWGVVREDYSPHGECWDYFSHDQARSRAYRWGEDGLLGITDRQCRLCFSLALWNERDPILKERLFGLTGPEGNHGEDVKESYFYVDSTPTHSYMKALYQYPQAEFPYAQLVDENRRRGKHEPEFELADSGVFADQRYFDVYAEYAKGAPDDLLIRITVTNHGNEAASIHLLPTLWYRNTWSWGCTHEGCEVKPRLTQTDQSTVRCDHTTLGRFVWHIGADSKGRIPDLLFTENESNFQRLFQTENSTPYVKDAFHDYVVHGRVDAVNPAGFGTKAAAYYVLSIPGGGTEVIELRLRSEANDNQPALGTEFDQTFSDRIVDADEFHDSRMSAEQSAAERVVSRQSNAGLLWSKQFYHYAVKNWLDGDPEHPEPPVSRKSGRNREWTHLFNRDIISMPDKWEYPWYAAWDLAFHMIPFARLDGDFAKEQLLLLLTEWYMHPNGQIPAYEFAFGDVNPPVHAWACWRVYKMTGVRGERDTLFLKRAFHKLMLNFNWWVNRKDPEGRNLFSGGFLGLDNIGVFDRSKPLPTGGYLEQADGTAWMAFYCATMLSMALELAKTDPAFEDIASKFFEHFVSITDAMNTLGGNGLWDEEDGFYYDVLNNNGSSTPLKIRSMVGIIPLFAVEILEQDLIDQLPGFRKRMNWFLKHRQDLARHIAYCAGHEHRHSGNHQHNHHRLLAIPSRERLQRVLQYILDEQEFLSPYGIRALSKIHGEKPYVFHVENEEHRVEYVPAESTSSLFGGNSNWRGPIWFPVNFLLVEALERYHHFYGDDFKVECPTGSGVFLNLKEVSTFIAARLSSIFLPDATGRRPCHGDDPRFVDHENCRDLVLFYEYFHGESGRGVGASHQTGWTALVSRLIDDVARSR